MPRLRFFASARDAAGTARAEVSGSTVGEVLDGAVARYGDALAEVIDHSRIWCNGEPADRHQAVADTDEVAVLPPVSGGSGGVEEHAG